MENNKILWVSISLFVIVVLSLFFVLLISNQSIKLNSAQLVKLKGYSNVNIVSPLEENGAIPVNSQDQTTRPFDIRVNQILDDSTYLLSVSPVINSYNLTLNTVVGLSVGDNIAFLEQNGNPELYLGNIESILVNTITLNNPVPYNFNPSIASVFTFDNDLTVDGSTTTQIFSITNFFNQEIDIVRFLFHCTDNVVMHDGLFCGNIELNRGVTLRKKLLDGTYINYWTIKNNGDWAQLTYDVSYSDKGKPPDSTYGFTTRLTYGGQSKHGVVIRLKKGESIEFLIQDDLTGISTSNLMVEGHFTQD